MKRWWIVLACLCALLPAACGLPTESIFPEREGKGSDPRPTEERESIFGLDGLTVFGKTKTDGQGPAGIGVNSYLWRASLDTLAFMPLVSADPFGGVIITDWYSPPATPSERFKITVFILDRQLRANGIRVAVFRQERGAGEWVDAVVRRETVIALEDAILTGARQLRVASLQGS